MTDDQPTTPQTVRDRLLAAGIPPERADAYLTAGLVRVGSETVTDPEHPLPWPAAFHIGGSS